MGDEPSPVQQAFSGKILIKSIIVAVIVGTLLNAINQGDLLMSGKSPVLWKALLTYIVPFCVSTFGAHSAIRQQAESRATFGGSTE
eukprot:SAG31_NODE_259_length_18917_cov_28.559677_18_plen_86_part_00